MPLAPELGHLHGDRFADFPLRAVCGERVEASCARPHHVLPESGWVTLPLGDAAELVGLSRLAHERALAAAAAAA